LGAIACNIGFCDEAFRWQHEAQSHICCTQQPERHVVFQLGITVRNSPVCVTNPETQNILGHTVLPQMRYAVSSEGVEPGLIAGLPIEKQHPHVLKHSLASHLVAGNVNVALVRQALGHRSINSTMQYVGTSDSQASEAAQAALMNLF
jgi:hypothetical protein